MLRERYMHPNGQIPGLRMELRRRQPAGPCLVHHLHLPPGKSDKGRRGQGVAQEQFPEAAAELHLVGQPQGSFGRNVFEGGFLGLDNIGVFDRSAPLPTGGYLEQADGTAWMALFCQNMLEIAVELAMTDPDYADMALKFCEHFLWIALVHGPPGRRHGHVG